MSYSEISEAPFHGKVAIVTGSASGIGRSIARQLGQRGAQVIVADCDDDGARRVAEDLRRGGAQAIAAAVDVRDPKSVETMVTRAIAEFQRIDILIHSAGIGVERRFLDISPHEWMRIIEVDLSGTFYCCQAVAKAMIQRRTGRIVTIASTAAIRGGVGRAAYGAAKGGVVALTKVMAVELAQFGITVNGLAPGAIETELVARMHSVETRRTYRAGIPLDRYGTPEEVAAGALFLASDEARYITGHILAIDGGFLAAGIMPKEVVAPSQSNSDSAT